MQANCYVTVATRSHLAQVAVLAESLHRAEPDSTLYVYLAERNTDDIPMLPGQCVMRALPEMGLADGEKLAFQYDAMSLCCALKPRAVRDVLRRDGCDWCVYVDSDMQVFASISDIVLPPLNEASVLLTPHVLQADSVTDPLKVLRSGVYNAGLFAVKDDAAGRAFLDWWSERTQDRCIGDPFAGLVHDQRWLDLAVGLFPGVRAVRHPGLNVGHWNLHEKALSRRQDQWWVAADHRLAVFHFSGVEAGRVSRFLGDEDALPGIEAARELAATYLQTRSGYEQRYPSSEPYSFARFASGAMIDWSMREVLRQGQVSSEQPFHEEKRIRAAAEGAGIRLRRANITRLVESASDCQNLLQRLEAHAIVGPVWRLVRRFINPGLSLDRDRQPSAKAAENPSR